MVEGGILVSIWRSGAKCAAPTALRGFEGIRFPALPGWATFCRAPRSEDKSKIRRLREYGHCYRLGFIATIRFLMETRFFIAMRFLAGLGFVIFLAAGPARVTARHMYQLATVR